MLEFLRFLGFTVLFVRFSYWVGSSLTISESKWKMVLLSQASEALLLFFIFMQLFSGGNIAVMHKAFWVQDGGFFLVLLGTCGAFVAKHQLGSAWVYASAYRIVKNQKLLTKGIYALTRHPIYSCFVVSYVGIELLAGSWLWISALCFLIPFYFQAKKEEKLLTKHFGKKYQEYQQKTKMLIPFVL